MTGEINPSHGLMDLTEACSTMQTAIINAEVSLSNVLMSELYLLNEEYNQQTNGDKEIAQGQPDGEQYTISYARWVLPENGQYTVYYYEVGFSDPGYPAADVTGTVADEDRAETEGTLNAFDGYMQTWQQSTESLVSAGYSQMNEYSSNQEGFVQFAKSANDVEDYTTNLVRQKQ